LLRKRVPAWQIKGSELLAGHQIRFKSLLAELCLIQTELPQASDQGGGESPVSLSEVASPCGVGLLIGWILPSCVRVTSAAQKTVDAVTEG